MISDLPPKIWLPPKPAIIRPAPVQKASFLPGWFPAPYVAAAPATFPVVRGQNFTANTGASASSEAIPLPAGTAAGDLILLFMTWYDGGGTITDFNGTTELYDIDGGSSTGQGVCVYKTATGSEGGSITITTSAPEFWGVTSIAIEAGTWQGTPESMLASSNNPPSLSPSWGSAKTLWIAACHRQSGTPSSGPSGYSGFVSSGDTDGDAGQAHAYLESEAASEDPGTFNIGNHTATIAIQPA